MKCDVCHRDVFLFNVKSKGQYANAPMLKDRWWHEVCSFYSLDDEDIVCDSCMESAIGELSDEKLRDCMLTEDWNNPKLETWQNLNKSIIFN